MNPANGSAELDLFIKTAKSTYEVGESVWLEINLHNKSKEPVKILKYFMLPADDPEKNDLEVRVYDPAGKRLSRISHVLTGRALYYPQVYSLAPGESYLDSIQLAGTFTQGAGRKKNKLALWSLGENPEINSLNEYPVMRHGTFKVQVIYQVDKEHLISLSQQERSAIWKGQLISNIIDISVI
jgi:hypothetical protein